MSAHAPQPSAVAVQVVDLVKSYGGRRVVDGVTLRAGLGAITAVLGPNGAGKTTTMEICEGYRTPDSGQVRVLGRDPRGAHSDLAARVGVCLQEGGVYGAVSPRQALRHAAALYRQPLPVPDLLDALGLTAAARTPYKRLSGGQQRRLALGLALVGRPEVAFLDEPTSGLDPQARIATWEVLRHLRADGVGVVLTTHYVEEAETLADHVVIIDAGRVVAAGPPRVLVAADEEVVVRFQAAAGLPVHDLSVALSRGGRGAAAQETAPGRYELRAGRHSDLLGSLSAWCRERSVHPLDLTMTRRTLSDVFLDLTGRELRE